MNWLSQILSGGTGELFAKIVGSFKLSPEKQAELMELKDQHAAELARLDAELQQKVLEAQQAEVAAASANIRAEAQSGDRYVSRARPSFIYLMLLIFFFNYVVFPLMGKTALQYPDALFWLFGSCMLGYTAARSWEKFMSLPGESTVQLGQSIKMSNRQQ
jgi:Holin of 3TMs, for gene-transfer release